MANLNYTLAKDLVVSSRGDLQMAYFLFKAAEHGLTYNVITDARNSIIYMTLQVYHEETGVLLYDLERWTVTKEGFPVTDEKGEIINYVNRYDDVINYLNSEGCLTKDGLEWAKSTPFNGGVVGDWI